MNQVSKFSLQMMVLMGLTLPTSASAGILTRLETQCQCLIQNATLGQMISLGVMLILVSGIVVVKLVSCKKLDPTVSTTTEVDSALQTLRQLKIGTGFSDWSDIRRLAGTKPPSQLKA